MHVLCKIDIHVIKFIPCVRLYDDQIILPTGVMMIFAWQDPDLLETCKVNGSLASHTSITQLGRKGLDMRLYSTQSECWSDQSDLLYLMCCT